MVFGVERKYTMLSSSNHLKVLLFSFSFWYTSVDLSILKLPRLILYFMQEPVVFKPETFLKLKIVDLRPPSKTRFNYYF